MTPRQSEPRRRTFLTLLLLALALGVIGGTPATPGGEILPEGEELAPLGEPPAGAGVGCYNIGNVAETGAVQIAARSTPPGSAAIAWQNPSIFTSIAPFRGSPNRPASHEGTDFVHANATAAPVVYVKAPADGVVVYCQTGCLQSTEIGSNTSVRECGQGWGNHLVLRHGNGTSIPFVYTRLAHLQPGSVIVDVGQPVLRGQTVAVMGNTGRSDTRHVHLELGTRAQPFIPGTPSQNFDRVWNFELLGRVAAVNTP